MKLLISFILSSLLLLTAVQAYTIGGAYASLISCDWGQYGYEYGYIGTYKVNGDIYRIFFGSNYCAY
jgi:hypothetical protein